VSTSLLSRETAGGTPARTCQAFAGTLLVPCPNVASETTLVHGEQREVCRAHTASPLARCD
jgi:hypothetical protein